MLAKESGLYQTVPKFLISPKKRRDLGAAIAVDLQTVAAPDIREEIRVFEN